MTLFTSGAEHQRAKNAAQTLLRKYKIRGPSEINVDLLAWAEFRALVKEGDVQSCAAAVVRAGKSGLILVNRYGHSGRKRFSVAHEMGHLSLHAGVNQMAVCSESDIFRYRKIRAEEPEANTFAVELLMPEEFFLKAVDQAPPAFELIEHLRKIFQTSLTATALRFVRLTSHPCALVMSEGDRIKWSCPSPTLRHALKEGKLDPQSFAIDFVTTPEKSTHIKKTNLASRWLANVKEDFTVTEQSRDLGAFGLLTLITCTSSAYTADNDDEDEDEGW